MGGLDERVRLGLDCSRQDAQRVVANELVQEGDAGFCVCGAEIHGCGSPERAASEYAEETLFYPRIIGRTVSRLARAVIGGHRRSLGACHRVFPANHGCLLVGTRNTW